MFWLGHAKITPAHWKGVEMRSENPRDILLNSGAVLEGHFALKSGRHSGVYVNKDEVYTNPSTIGILACDLGHPFIEDDVEAVVGPAIGGVILAHGTAKFLNLDKKLERGDVGLARSLFADKDGDRFIIKRGYDVYIRGRRVLLVEDIMTSGGSIRATADAVRRVGGEVVGVAAICNRGKVTAESLGVPKLVSLVEMDLVTWTADECPLCEQGIPVNTEIGHGADYVAKLEIPDKRPLSIRTLATTSKVATESDISGMAKTSKFEKPSE